MNRTLKGVCICLLLVLPFTGSAKIGWRVENYYALYGLYHYSPSGWINTVEFGYDLSRRSCLVRPTYAGVGVVAGFGNQYKEIGISAFFNPIKRSIGISRKARLNPYLYAQANWRLQTPSGLTTRANARFGGGLAGVFLSTSLFSIRTKLQIGYSPTDYNEPVLHGVVAEFKVGFALNSNWIRNARKDKMKSQDSG